MANNGNSVQEARPERAVLLCTTDEKHAIRVLSALRKVSETEFLRAHLDFEAIMREYERLKPFVEDVA